MSISELEIEVPFAERVTVSRDTLCVDLSDGRSISAPLSWYPRLQHASVEERTRWRLIGNGVRIHWQELDEDISVEGLLAGRPSGESQLSFKRWLTVRASRLTSKVRLRSRSEPRSEPFVGRARRK